MANRKLYNGDGTSSDLQDTGILYLVGSTTPLATLRLFSGSGGGGGGGVTDRSSLNGLEGTYNPLLVPDSYGIPAGTTLKAGPTGLVTLTGSGPYIYEDMDCPAYFQIRTGARVEFRRCKIRGYNRYAGVTTTGGNTALINCDHASAANVLIEDCEIANDYPTSYADGVIGHDYIARRNYVHHNTDGFGIRNGATPGGPVGVQLLANVVDRGVYWTPDYPNSSRANTHNDCVAVNDGQGWVIRGNNLKDNAATDAGTPPFGIGTGANPNTKWFPSLNGQAILIQVSVTGGTISGTIDRNFIDYGARGLSLVDSNGGVVVVTSNEFGTNQGNGGPQIQIAPNESMVGNWNGSTAASFKDSWYGNTSTAGGNATVKRAAFG